MTLLNNNKYTIDVTINGYKFSEWFYSQLDPLYNTIKAIRNSEIGYLLGEVSNKDIILKLFEVSQDIKELADENDYTWEDDEPAPIAVRRLTAAKTKYDMLMYRNYLSNQQFNSASLADFDVSSIDYERIEPLIDDLKDDIEKWEKMIIGKSSPTSVLKSENQAPYPFSDRNSF